LALFNDENFNFVIETDVLANIKTEIEEPNSPSSDINFFNESTNVYVQLKTEDTCYEESNNFSNDASDSSNFSYYEKRQRKKKQHHSGNSKYNDHHKRLKRCRYCSEQFKGNHKLRKHEAKYHAEQFEIETDHKSDRIIGCAFCFSRFYSVKDMNIHIKNIHRVDSDLLSYFCAHCSFSTNQKSKLEYHIKTEHFNLPGKSFKCSYCDIRCVNAQNLKKHLANKHKISDPDVLYCDICSFSSKVKTKINTHMARVHLKIVNDFLCTKCEVVCQNKKERDLHHFAHCDIVEVIDQSLEKLTCTICREQYGERVDLLNHLESHRNDVEFTTTPCVLCYKPVTGYQHLLDHTREFHATKNAYRCRECKRCYPYGMKFLMHIQNHKNSDQTHLCAECGESFRTVCLLNKHIRIDHRQVLKCPHCPNKVYKSLVAYR
jgi:disulfide oxidoreductase YuzD